MITGTVESVSLSVIFGDCVIILVSCVSVVVDEGELEISMVFSVETALPLVESLSMTADEVFEVATVLLVKTTKIARGNNNIIMLRCINTTIYLTH